MSEELDFVQPKKVVGEMISMSVVEDIKAEIESKKQYRGKSGNSVIDAHDIGLDRYFDKGLDMALSIIDKHISKGEQCRQ